MTTELTEEEFKSTFGNRMIDVTDSAEPVLDIWPIGLVAKRGYGRVRSNCYLV